MSTNDTQNTPATDEGRPVPSLPEDMLIVLPVRNMVLYPGVILPVAIKREKTVAGAQEAVRADSKVGVTTEDAAALLGRTPDVLVPSSRDITRSVNEATPIVADSPTVTLAKTGTDGAWSSF